MTIFILRHGQAEPQRTTDDARQLTDKGRTDTARVIRARLDDMRSLTQIWASPLVRAQQTAEIAASYFPRLEIQTTDLLVPEASPQVLTKWLYEINAHGNEDNQSLLLISHQPLVGSLLNWLCGKPNDFYPMGTSSLAAIRAQVIAADMADLLWLDHA